jgi:hypothetical protein
MSEGDNSIKRGFALLSVAIVFLLPASVFARIRVHSCAKAKQHRLSFR